MASNLLKIYGFPLSQPYRSVIMLCKAASVPFQPVLIDALKGETRKPEFRKISPTGLVPVIDDNGYVLHESAAILSYICESRKLKDWLPDDAKERGNINAWMHWHHANTRKGTLKVLRQMLFPKKGADPAVEAADLEKSLKEMYKSIGLIESHLTQSKSKFLVGSKHPTIADLLIIPELDQLSEKGFNLANIKQFPAVCNYINTIEAEVSSYKEVFQAVADARRDGYNGRPLHK